MGIKTSYQIFLNCGKICNIESLPDNSVIVIDMMTYIIRFYKMYKLDKSCTNWLKKVLTFIRNIQNKKNKLRCIAVFDGPNKPIEKHPCMVKRKINNFKYSKNDPELLNDMKLLTEGKHDILREKYKMEPSEIFGYISDKICSSNNSYPTHDEMFILYILLKEYSDAEIIMANGEAESYCCYLLNSGQADYAISEDSDLIMYNATKFIMKYNEGNGILFDIENIQKQHNLNKEELFCLGNILGNDYTEGLDKIGFKRGIELIRKQGVENISKLFVNPNYLRLQELFTPSDLQLTINYTTEDKKIAIENLKC
jgi:5'-3' exonuclease